MAVGGTDEAVIELEAELAAARKAVEQLSGSVTYSQLTSNTKSTVRAVTSLISAGARHVSPAAARSAAEGGERHHHPMSDLSRMLGASSGL